jgi:hypothetical protein
MMLGRPRRRRRRDARQACGSVWQRMAACVRGDRGDAHAHAHAAQIGASPKRPMARGGGADEQTTNEPHSGG